MTGYELPTGQWRINVDASGNFTFSTVAGSDGVSPTAITGSGTTSDPYKLANYEESDKGSITINKQNQSEAALDSVYFTIEQKDSNGDYHYIQWDNSAGAWVQVASSSESATNVSGVLKFTDLPDGEYRITEVASKSRYTLLKKPFEVELPYKTTTDPATTGYSGYYEYDSGSGLYSYYELTYTITNMAVVELPAAGDVWNQYLLIPIGVGIILFGAAMCVLVYRRREKNQ